MEVYTLSLKERTKMKGLLEVVSSSAEFESIPIHRHEDALLRRIYDRVPVNLDRVDFEAPHFKTFLLLATTITKATKSSSAYSTIRASSNFRMTALRSSIILVRPLS